MGDHRRQGGFTLLETLIAMVVLALIATILAGGLRFVTAAWDRGEAAAGANATLALTQDLLRREAASAVRLAWGEGDARRAVFAGRSDRIAFVAAEPPYPAEAGLAVVAFSVVTGGGRAVLRFARAPYTPDLDSFDEVEATEDLVLAEGAVDFAFAYFGLADPDRPPGWTEEWLGRVGPPLLVRLRATERETGLPAWPDIVVPLAVDIEAACIPGDEAAVPADEEPPPDDAAPAQEAQPDLCTVEVEADDIRT